jgi:hypothetical protein
MNWKWTTNQLEANYDLNGSELKHNWKIIELNINKKLGTSLLQVMDEYSNEWTP